MEEFKGSLEHHLNMLREVSEYFGCKRLGNAFIASAYGGDGEDFLIDDNIENVIEDLRGQFRQS